jgi:hypothetical protein
LIDILLPHSPLSLWGRTGVGISLQIGGTIRAVAEIDDPAVNDIEIMILSKRGRQIILARHVLNTSTLQADEVVVLLCSDIVTPFLQA